MATLSTETSRTRSFLGIGIIAVDYIARYGPSVGVCGGLGRKGGVGPGTDAVHDSSTDWIPFAVTSGQSGYPSIKILLLEVFLYYICTSDLLG